MDSGRSCQSLRIKRRTAARKTGESRSGCAERQPDQLARPQWPDSGGTTGFAARRETCYTDFYRSAPGPFLTRRPLRLCGVKTTPEFSERFLLPPGSGDLASTRAQAVKLRLVKMMAPLPIAYSISIKNLGCSVSSPPPLPKLPPWRGWMVTGDPFSRKR